MKGTHLGEFEELVLLVIGALDKNAFGAAIKNEITLRTGRIPSTGALHSSIHRLAQKGFIDVEEDQNPHNRGRPKKYYSLTSRGKDALVTVNNLRNELFDLIPNLIN